MANVQHNTATAANLHTLIRWTVANSAARLALSVVAADIGKLCLQSDTGACYILTATTPVWLGLLILNTDGTGTTWTTNTQVVGAQAIFNFVFQGLTGYTPHTAVDCATTTVLPAGTYANGTAGVGATFTVTATGTLTIDGHLTILGDRVLVKNQVAGLQDGIFTITTAGATGVSAVLTRATDADTSAELLNSIYAVLNGTVNAPAGVSTFWYVNNTAAITIGTDAIGFTQIQTPSQGGGPPGQQFSGMLLKQGNAVSFAIDQGTAYTTPVDADEIPVAKSASSFAAFKVTLTNFKAYLKTYFDTLYATIASVPAAANPTASVGSAAVNGSATTFMRSDAAPVLGNIGPGATGPIGSATVVPIVTIDAQGRTTALSSTTITQPTAANPSGTIGATAVNGSAATFMRSDGAPPFNIAGLTAKTSLVSADGFVIADSAASNALKEVTVATLDARYAQVALSNLVADYATTGALSAGTYLNGVAGVGATYTVTATGAQTVDGRVLVAGDRLLVKNQASTFQDGLYTVTIAGALGVALVLTRSIDMDIPSEFNGAVVLVVNGTANAGTYWVQTSTVTTIGSDTQTWSQFNPQIAANSVTNAMLAQAGAKTLKGNATAGTANVSDLTAPVVSGVMTASGFTTTGAPILASSGASVAAANNLVLGADGNVFHITGATQINLLATTNFQSGATVVLIFDSNPVVKHNQTPSGVNKAINLYGGLDYTPIAHPILILTYDGTAWQDSRLSMWPTASVGVTVRRTTNQSLSDGVAAAVSFDTADNDVGGFWNAGTPTLVTIPVGFGGVYAVTGCIRFAASAAGNRDINLSKNGGLNNLAEVSQANTGGSLVTIMNASVARVRLEDGDTVVMSGFQNSGGSLNMVASSPQPSLCLTRLGA